LKRLVDACHAQGVGVVLDVVYNHLGPEGNYAGDFGPYFTEEYKTPWGAALNFEQPYSDEVRRYFIDNAVEWIADFHIDGLRLDAIHAIVDPSATGFVEELSLACHNKARELGRQACVIAESNRNDQRIVIPREYNGWGVDSQWNDDFHHSLRVTLTGEKVGYYQDFSGVRDLAQAMAGGFVYQGQYSRFRRRSYGNSSRDLPGERFVVFSQNHDQVGNRKVGDRLTSVLSFEQLKIAAAAVLLSPYIPLLFMGEEYGEPAPFQYFVSHGDPSLIEAVRSGRAVEFSGFEWAGELPDPQQEGTFLHSKLDWGLRQSGKHRVLLGFYEELLRLRREISALRAPDKNACEVQVLANEKTMLVRRWQQESEALAVFHFAERSERLEVPSAAGQWSLRLDSAQARWNGPGNEADEGRLAGPQWQIAVRPWSVLLYLRSTQSNGIR